jgi:pyruvate kinase
MSHAASDLDLSAIAIFTETGSTARLLSKYHPEPPIYALSPFEEVVNRSMLLWGTYPVLCKRFHATDELVDMAEEMLEELGFVEKRQILGIVAGTRTKSGATNFMRLHMIGDRDTDPPEPEKPAEKHGKAGKTEKSKKSKKKKH